MLVVSYYTRGTPYEQEAQHLRDSLNRLGVPHYIRGIQPRGSWQANCLAKAEFLRGVMGCVDSRVLYVDADAEVVRWPGLLDGLPDGSFDMGVHYRDGSECLSGTVLLEPTPTCRSTLDRWVGICKEKPEQWDQLSLDEALKSLPSSRVYHLPPGMCSIFDGNMCPDDELFIRHNQKSREHKRAVEGATTSTGVGLPLVFSHMRSGTSLLMAMLHRNLEFQEDLTTPISPRPNMDYRVDGIPEQHSPWGKLFGGHRPYSVFGPDAERILYVLRDPRDVMRSLFLFETAGTVHEDGGWSALDEWLTDARIRAWKQHVDSYWHNVTCVKYEDLCDDDRAREFLSKVAATFGLKEAFKDPLRGGTYGWSPRFNCAGKKSTSIPFPAEWPKRILRRFRDNLSHSYLGYTF